MAADQAVTVGNNQFSPVEVLVNSGDKVTWTFQGVPGNHSVTSESGQAETFDSDPGNPNPAHPHGTSFDHTFNNTGCVRYFCKVHSTMRGRVRVNGAQCSSTAPPSPPPGYGDPPPAGGGDPNDAVRPAISSIEARARTLCVRRTDDCRRTSTLVSFRLSEGARVVASIVLVRSARRSARTVRRLRIIGRAGVNRFRLRSRRLKAGSYRLRLAATDPAGNKSRLKSIRFRVKR